MTPTVKYDAEATRGTENLRLRPLVWTVDMGTTRRTEGADPREAVSGRAVVSVIVPVYNVEAYLRECLDSVVGQTLGFDRIELIAIDDGSTDGSGRMLDAYAARCPMTVRHEPNSGGAGRPRNVGLDLATGQYVFFSTPTTTWEPTRSGGWSRRPSGTMRTS
jgi:cellulose synthase/poly-beta-1,6-N-acetylglucosamine synthase-like glycosyltransferase